MMYMTYSKVFAFRSVGKSVLEQLAVPEYMCCCGRELCDFDLLNSKINTACDTLCA